MVPLTITAAQAVQQLLQQNQALGNAVSGFASQAGLTIPAIAPDQIVLSSASPDLGDKDIQLTYPRVCVHSAGLKNTQQEKFRSVSGAVLLRVDVWASANLATDSDSWIHYYVAAVSSVLAENVGDWGNGMFFDGAYDVQFQPPKSGGLGFAQSATISFEVIVSLA